MEIEIHEQEIFIQMLLDDAVADPRELLDQMKRKEKAQKILEEKLEQQEEAKRANVIENRVNDYQAPKSNKLLDIFSVKHFFPNRKSISLATD